MDAAAAEQRYVGQTESKSKFARAFFRARAGDRSHWRATCAVVLTGASTSGRAVLLRSRALHPGASPNRTARAIHFRSPLLPVAKQAAGVSSQDRTVVPTAASPSGSQGCRLKAQLSFASGARSASPSSAVLRLETNGVRSPCDRRLAALRSRSTAAQQAVAADGRASSPPDASRFPDAAAA